MYISWFVVWVYKKIQLFFFLYWNLVAEINEIIINVKQPIRILLTN